MGDLTTTNIALDVFSAIIVLFVTISAMGKEYNKNALSKAFVLLCVVVMSMMISDALGWLFDGTTDSMYRIILRISDFWLFISGFLCLTVFTLYIHIRVSSVRKVSNSYLILSCAIFLFGLAITIISQFNGMVYYFDNNGIYHRGSFYIVSQATLLCVVIVNTIIACNKKNRIQRSERISIIIYAWLPVVAVIIQTFTYGISLTCPSGCISLLLIYINIQSGEMVRIRQHSELDALTDLFNRTKYENSCSYEYLHLQSCGIIWFDINNLKEVNDEFGHEAGDELLVQLADSIRSITNRNIHGYRMGGDEFMTVVCNCTEYELQTITELWSARLSYINKISAHPCSVAFGTAWARGEFSIEELLHKADNEMYVNKKNYKLSLQQKIQA